MNPLLVDGSGDLGPSPVWPPQLTPGEYDLVFDANQNGRYDTATDVVDDPNHPGFVVDDISAVIDPDVGGTIVYTDPQGLITAITVPPGAVDEPVILCFHPLLEPSYALPTQMEYANHAFLLGECQFPGPPIPVGGVTFPFALPGLGPRGDAPGLYPYLPLIMRDDSGGCRILGNTAIGRPSPSRKALAAPYLRTVAYVSRAGALSAFTFDVPIVISVGYSDSDLPFGMDENDLLLLYWTGTEWADAATTCWPLSNYVRDTVNNILQVEVCHLTEFAFGG
jgi:hypothetical protein